ncbi:MAG: ATP-binding cassette domain-containing protein, partial [Desulfobacteraceae bacterium]|nr:ATP-binding cassette domain-containing protein [Desulfobacteraceae bacterium]
MIKVNNLSKHFGGIRAVDKVNLHIKKGSITGLIGPNGAGKTTLFNLIAGLYKPTSGKIYLEKEDITGLDSHNLFHKGLLRTFQIAHPFPTLTVLENLMMVPGNQLGENIINSWLRRGQIRKQENKLQKKAE